MATVPKFRIDADVHGEVMVLPPNTPQPPTEKGLTLSEPQFPHCPEKLSDPGPGSPPEKRDWTLSQTYRAMRGWLFPYIRSRVLPGKFPTTPSASMSIDHNLISIVKVVSIGLFCLASCVRSPGAELKSSTAQAFQEYVQTRETHIQSEVSDPERFLQIDELPDTQKAAVISRLRSGEVLIQPMRMNGRESPIEIPGGLVHHWWAIAFVPGAKVGQVLQLSQDYPRYADLYKPDVQYAKVLNHDGHHFDVDYRFYQHTIVSVVYNAEFEVDYFMPENSKNYIQAHSIRIAEVQNPGKPSEREFPVGKDHGYMWRLNLYSRYVERDGGVYVQVEFLALSRTVPAVFAWLVNPYMRSIPRDYLRRYLDETRAAVSDPQSGASEVAVAPPVGSAINPHPGR